MTWRDRSRAWTPAASGSGPERPRERHSLAPHDGAVRKIHRPQTAHRSLRAFAQLLLRAARRLNIEGDSNGRGLHERLAVVGVVRPSIRPARVGAGYEPGRIPLRQVADRAAVGAAQAKSRQQEGAGESLESIRLDAKRARPARYLELVRPRAER